MNTIPARQRRPPVGSLLLLTAMAALAAGCAKTVVDRTALEVRVDSDLPVPGQLDEIRIQVRTGDRNTTPTAGNTKEFPFLLAAQGTGKVVTLPLSMSFTPNGDFTQVFVVDVSGLLQNTKVIVRSFQIDGFAKGEARVLKVVLNVACQGRCVDVKSCSDPQCGLMVINPNDLPVSSPADAGTSDAAGSGGSGGSGGGSGSGGAGVDGSLPDGAVDQEQDRPGTGGAGGSVVTGTGGAGTGGAGSGGSGGGSGGASGSGGMTVDAGPDLPAPECVAGATPRSCALDGAKGNCAKGTRPCVDGKWGPCSVMPLGADSCAVRGDDATCDGVANDKCPCLTGDTQVCGPAQVGICRPGTQTCNNGSWGGCVGAVNQAPRNCASAADNNCDGKPDNILDDVCIVKVAPTTGCGKATGPTGAGTIVTSGSKPAGCADSLCGPWTYTRNYNVILPSGYNSQTAYPLVFQGPGCGGGAANVYPLNNNADNTVIRVGLGPPPNTIGHSTNPGQGCFDDKEGDDSVDWPFYEALWDQLADQFCFDKNRVFASGNSSGAWLANELGCKYAGDPTHPIRGVLPNTGGLPTQIQYVPTCTTKPMAGMWIHEIGDPENPFAGTKTAVNRAMAVNGCTGSNYDAAQFDDFPIGGGVANSTCKKIRGCPDIHPLVVCALPGTAHASHDSTANPGFSTFLKMFSMPPLLTP